MAHIKNRLQKWLLAHTSHTMLLRYFALTKIPMLFFTRPAVVEISEERTVIKVALCRRTKNHLGSMYFGALCAGADCAAGVYAMSLIQKRPEPISLIFKNLKAEFLQRAENDVYFHCDQGRKVADLVTAAAHSHERLEMPVHIEAMVPGQGKDPVAKFILTLSLKKK